MFALLHRRNPNHHERKITRRTTGMYWNEMAKEEFALLRADKPHLTLESLISEIEALAVSRGSECVNRHIVSVYFGKGE